MAREAAAQLHLLDFAGRAVAQRLHEHDIIGHPPFSDLAFKVMAIDCAVGLAPAAGTTTSSGRSSHFGCGTPIMAASATPGQPTGRFSMRAP